MSRYSWLLSFIKCFSPVEFFSFIFSMWLHIPTLKKFFKQSLHSWSHAHWTSLCHWLSFFFKKYYIVLICCECVLYVDAKMPWFACGGRRTALWQLAELAVSFHCVVLQIKLGSSGLMGRDSWKRWWSFLFIFPSSLYISHVMNILPACMSSDEGLVGHQIPWNWS